MFLKNTFFNSSLLELSTPLEQFAILDSFEIIDLIQTKLAFFEGNQYLLLLFNNHTSIFLSNYDLSFLQQIISITLIICVFFDCFWVLYKKQKAKGQGLDKQQALLIVAALLAAKLMTTVKLQPKGLCEICRTRESCFYGLISFDKYWLTNQNDSPIKNINFFTERLVIFCSRSNYWQMKGLNQIKTHYFCHECTDLFGEIIYNEIEEKLFAYKPEGPHKYMRHKYTNQLTSLNRYIENNTIFYPFTFERVNPIKWLAFWFVMQLYRFLF